MRWILLLLSLPAFAQFTPPSGGGSGCGNPNCTVTGNLTVSGTATSGTTVLPFSGNVTTAIATPAAPAVVRTCPSGSCSVGNYQYCVAANGRFSTVTACSPISSNVNNLATLDSTHYNTVPTVDAVGSVTCSVYRTFAGGGTHAQGLIGAVACGASLVDNGLAATGGAASWPTRNTTGAQISQGAIGVPGITVVGAIDPVWQTTNAHLPVFEVWNPNYASGVGQHALQVWEDNGVWVNDYLLVGPIRTGAAMIHVGSDLGAGGLVAYLGTNPTYQNDFLEMHDLSTTDVIRFNFSDSGILAFGGKVNTVPGLKPDGTELQALLGDGSGPAPFYAGNGHFIGAGSTTLTVEGTAFGASNIPVIQVKNNTGATGMYRINSNGVGGVYTNGPNVGGTTELVTSGGALVIGGAAGSAATYVVTSGTTKTAWASGNTGVATTIWAGAAGQVAMAIQGFSAQTADLLTLNVNGGSALFSVTASGHMNLFADKASSGTRFLCVDSAGLVTASASACSGT